jgi:hypothetical protein
MKVKYSVEMEEIPRPKKQEEIIYNHICKAKDGLMNTEIVKLTGFGSRRVREATLYLKTVRKIKVGYCRCHHAPIYYKL